MSALKVYVASSWRNPFQPELVVALREAGHVVYDFRHPAPGDNGFKWSAIDPAWEKWTPEEFREALQDPIAARGFGNDMRALQSCDACVLLMPCGRSAHLELGYAVGAGKRTVVLLAGSSEPELMYLMVDRIAVTLGEVLDALAEPLQRKAVGR